MSETRVSRNPRSSKTLRAARRISLRRSRPLEVSGPALRRSRWDAEAPVTTRPAGLPPRGLMAPPVSVPGPQLALEYLATGVDRQRIVPAVIVIASPRLISIRLVLAGSVPV